MADLLRKPVGEIGAIHQITPAAAGWTYVGFELHRLATGDSATGAVEGRETILVVVEGTVHLSVGGVAMGAIGQRKSVFEASPPQSVFVPAGTRWQGLAATDASLAVCTAPGGSDHPAQVLPEPARLTRGTGTNTRHIYPIAMEDADVAASLLVTEVFTPSGHWSSYPPHRHDEDDFPRMTYLEETYYHRLSPSDAFGIQRVFTEDGSLDETMAVADHDVVLVPRGHHPCAAPHGVEMYYLNVMAGPLRKWRFQNHPAFDWIANRDTA
ncbi:MAG: 5-deoxy-glucuronate isomerase [Pseudomonadota bacterium]